MIGLKYWREKSTIFHSYYICVAPVAEWWTTREYLDFGTALVDSGSSANRSGRCLKKKLFPQDPALTFVRGSFLVAFQEEYIKDEMKNLKRELIRAKEEIKRIQSVPLVIGQFNEIIDANYGIVGESTVI